MKKENECWIWSGTKNQKGYGVMNVGNLTVTVHRVSYRLHHGPIPLGMFVCHKCDNPACINPNHLFIGTAKDNTQDMTNKGRGLYGRFPVKMIDTKLNAEFKFNTQRELGTHLGLTQSAVSFAMRKGSLLQRRYKVIQYNEQKK